jgi:TRAP-type uncharacterized transport system, periplasmic component
MREKN